MDPERPLGGRLDLLRRADRVATPPRAESAGPDGLGEDRPLAELDALLREVDGVDGFEGWHRASARRDDLPPTEREPFSLQAVPPDSPTLSYELLRGAWLDDSDEAIVLNHVLAARSPDLEVGDTLPLRCADDHSTWRIVGVVREIGGSAGAYVALDAVRRAHGREDVNHLIVTPSEPGSSRELMQRLEDRLDRAGIPVHSARTRAMRYYGLHAHVVLLYDVLAMVSLVVVAVGGFGLFTTTSLHVLERATEIAVLRALGAGRRAVCAIVLIEAGAVALLSAALALAIAAWLGPWVADTSGELFVRSPLEEGSLVLPAFGWTGISLAVGLLASLWPALRSTHAPVSRTLVSG